MPNFCINKNAQSNGDHEVHDLTPGKCNYLPDPANRIQLGSHASCKSAVAFAKKQYRDERINGCYWCSNECHTT
jgi:hypothetical protein